MRGKLQPYSFLRPIWLVLLDPTPLSSFWGGTAVTLMHNKGNRPQNQTVTVSGMDTQVIERWAHEAIARVKAGYKSENTRVELKAEWPSPDKAAIRVAAHANASYGGDILLPSRLFE